MSKVFAAEDDSCIWQKGGHMQRVLLTFLLLFLARAHVFLHLFLFQTV